MQKKGKIFLTVYLPTETIHGYSELDFEISTNINANPDCGISPNNSGTISNHSSIAKCIPPGIAKSNSTDFSLPIIANLKYVNPEYQMSRPEAIIQECASVRSYSENYAQKRNQYFKTKEKLRLENPSNYMMVTQAAGFLRPIRLKKDTPGELEFGISLDSKIFENKLTALSNMNKRNLTILLKNLFYENLIH